MMDVCVALSEVIGNALEEHDQNSCLTQNEMGLWHDYKDSRACSGTEIRSHCNTQVIGPSCI